MAAQTVFLVFSFIFGAVVGSFLNVCIYRLPWEKSLIWPGSHCPKCLRPVRAFDNVPILSWLFLRGRCRDCGEQFSARYMLIELLTAGLFAITFWISAPVDIAGFARYALYIFLLSALIVATFIDLDLQIIPDSVTVPGMLLALIGCTVLTDLPLVPVTDPTPDLPMAAADRWMYTLVVLEAWGMWLAGVFWLVCTRGDGRGTAESVIFTVAGVYLVGQTYGALVAWEVAGAGWAGWAVWFAQHPHWQGLATAIIGMLIGSGFIWFVRVVGSAVMGREAMGFGDVTLMALVGAFLGWQAALCVFFLAPFMGLAVGLFQWIFRGNNVLPYGPYLSLASAVALFGWPIIWPWLEPRLAILALVPVLWGGIAIQVLLGIVLISLRVNARREELAVSVAEAT